MNMLKITCERLCFLVFLCFGFFSLLPLSPSAQETSKPLNLLFSAPRERAFPTPVFRPSAHEEYPAGTPEIPPVLSTSAGDEEIHLQSIPRVEYLPDQNFSNQDEDKIEYGNEYSIGKTNSDLVSEPTSASNFATQDESEFVEFSISDFSFQITRTYNNDLPKLPNKRPFPFLDVSLQVKSISNTSFALASFVRNGRLWIVCDCLFPKSITSTLNLHIPDLSPILLLQEKERRGSALVFHAPLFTRSRVRNNDGVWTIKISPQPILQSRGVFVQRSSQDGNTVLHIGINNLSGALYFEDPEIRDQLIIIPSTVSEGGVLRNQYYTGFQILNSEQGVAISTQGHTPNFLIKEREVKIFSDFLTPVFSLSNGKERVSYEDQPPDLDDIELEEHRLDYIFVGEPLTPSLRLSQWRGNKKFIEKKNDILGALRFPGPENNIRLREDIVRLFFAYGLNLESELTLANLIQFSRRVERDFEHKLIHAINSVSRLDIKQSQDLFSQANIQSSLDASPWLALLALETGLYKIAAEYFIKGKRVIDFYPPFLREKFILHSIEAMIRSGYYERSSELISSLEDEGLDGISYDRLNFLQGLLFYMQENYDQARYHLEIAAHSGEALIVAQATYLLIESDRLEDKLSEQEEIERFESLRTLWSGDGFEYHITKKLIDHAISRNDLRRALDLFRGEARSLQGFSGYFDLAEDMNRIYDRVFLDPSNPVKSPLDGYMIFRNFPELFPGGEKGVKILDNVTERLEAMYLFQTAADLLDDPVMVGLNTDDQERAARKASHLWLESDRPENALSSFERTQEKRAGDSFLLGQIFFALGRLEESKRAISELTDIKAIRLRSKIAISEQNWDEIIDQQISLLATELLTSEETLDAVIYLASGYYRRGQYAKLSALEKEYSDVIDQVFYKEALSALTLERGEGLTDLNVVQTVQDWHRSFSQLLNQERGE